MIILKTQCLNLSYQALDVSHGPSLRVRVEPRMVVYAVWLVEHEFTPEIQQEEEPPAGQQAAGTGQQAAGAGQSEQEQSMSPTDNTSVQDDLPLSLADLGSIQNGMLIQSVNQILVLLA